MTSPIPKFAKLDRLIIEHIQTGKNTFGRLQGGEVLAEAKLHAKIVDRCGKNNAWRVIDRRLQALRKKGLIHFQSGRWSVVQEPMDSAVGKLT